MKRGRKKLWIIALHNSVNKLVYIEGKYVLVLQWLVQVLATICKYATMRKQILIHLQDYVGCS